MANKTIGIFSATYAGTTGAKMLLKNLATGAVGNAAGGDALTETADGFFSCVVDEAISGVWAVVVVDSADEVLIEGGFVDISQDVEALFLVDDPRASYQTGIGPNIVTLTVSNGTTGIVGAIVQLTNGGVGRTQVTTTGGIVRFSLPNGDYGVAVHADGYTFTPTTLTVNGTENETLTMSPISITPSDPGKVTGFWVVNDASGDAVANVSVKVRAKRPQFGSAGIVHSTAERTETSDANGIAAFSNLYPGWVYSVTIDRVVTAEITIPADATGTIELGSVTLPE